MVYKPKIVNQKKGNSVIRVIEDKRYEEIGERGVMDRTIEQYELNETETILQSGIFMEEVASKSDEKTTLKDKYLELSGDESIPRNWGVKKLRDEIEKLEQ